MRAAAGAGAAYENDTTNQRGVINLESARGRLFSPTKKYHAWGQLITVPMEGHLLLSLHWKLRIVFVIEWRNGIISWKFVVELFALFGPALSIFIISLAAIRTACVVYDIFTSLQKRKKNVQIDDIRAVSDFLNIYIRIEYAHPPGYVGWWACARVAPEAGTGTANRAKGLYSLY